MTYETILPGTPELNQESDPVLEALIDIRQGGLVDGDVEATIEELRWYKNLRDAAESIGEDDRVTWRELHHKYQKLSDDQIEELIHKLEESENGDYINQ
jgi:hypothetical protein